MHFISTSFVLFASFTPTALSLGINCRGSDDCTVDNCGPDALGYIDAYLGEAVKAGKGGHHFKTGEHISCKGHCCAFFQTAGASGSTQDALNHVKNLYAHGCRICGSDPTKPGNDVSKGQLTINYVNNDGPNHCYKTYCG